MFHLIHFLPLVVAMISPWAGILIGIVILHSSWSYNPNLKSDAHHLLASFNELKKHPLAFAADRVKLVFGAVYAFGTLLMHSLIFWLMLAFTMEHMDKGQVFTMTPSTLVALCGIFSVASFCGSVNRSVEKLVSTSAIMGILGWWMPAMGVFATKSLLDPSATSDMFASGFLNINYIIVAVAGALGVIVGLVVVNRKNKASDEDVEPATPLQLVVSVIIGAISASVTFAMMFTISVGFSFDLGNDQKYIYDIKFDEMTVVQYENKVDTSEMGKETVLFNLIARGETMRGSDYSLAKDSESMTKLLTLSIVPKMHTEDAKKLIEFISFDPVASGEFEVNKRLWASYMMFDGSYDRVLKENALEIKKLQRELPFKASRHPSKGMTDAQMFIETSYGRLMYIEKMWREEKEPKVYKKRDWNINLFLEQIEQSRATRKECPVQLTGYCFS
ncbi:hypothetical protein [Vibrio crassostreae]|uniref:hypothetical protein n=1 Tax=Vibrio crassostreae TaxID=246167 RepID=UPI001B313205|nr:hypothetical protein [Vibrio crassostreae]